MNELKKIVFFIIDALKKLFLLNNLSKKELQGFSSPLTILRFLPNTIVKVPYSLGRTVRGVSFDKNILLDPAGRMCSNISKQIENKTIFDDLSKIFIEQKNMSAADIVHLNKNEKLKHYPAWAIVMPWEELSIEEMFDSYPQYFFKNRSTNGLIFENESRESIIKTMYSKKFIQNRIDQMAKLYKSIEEHGIIKNFDLPKIKILSKNNHWRWFMGDGGNHRSFVLSCLGHDFFLARVSSIIDIKDVDNWHNVKNGTYSVIEAQNIFESYFEGSRVYRGMV
ncbi:MAG: hypothetical protein CBC45_001615 [Euryarchaeota archaeon TMED85]|nr:MAG: hypothetical protein CBC45_001615 [Euryarchaeota archaeon TMED85]|tara:strand:+ start:17517 stop:18356 length:840 start_codon:yes stop_codon:yes gene_type:complete